MDAATANFYQTNARRLAADYARTTPDYLALADRIFEKAQLILDVGCGTGRDCLHFLRQGKNVFGADGSAAMLAEAQTAFRLAGFPPQDRLFEATLPGLDPFEDASFDGVLCSAVLMHLPEESIFDAVYGLKRVLRPGGYLLISIPLERSGIDLKTNRDPDGRLYTPLPAAKLQILFERVGFTVVSSQSSEDSLGRPGHNWKTFVFQRLDESRDRPLQLVEGILNRDKKVATYKLALFRALAEIAQTQHHLADFTREDKVLIPLVSLAEKWMFYYWPIFEDASVIRQGTNRTGSDVAIRPQLEALIRLYQRSGGLSAFYVDWKSGRLSKGAIRLVNSALSKLQQTIWTMPVRHAGGGEFDVFQYDREEKAVAMDASLWRELCLTGNWIQDATVLRWAELTEQINGGKVKASRMIDCLLTVPNAARNVEDARRYFDSLSERNCVWTERALPQAYAVDHAMPFALWRNNDLWNLFPTDLRINNQKRDSLPTYQLLHRQRDRIIYYWRGLEVALGERFEREARTLLGRGAFQRESWEPQLFNRFVEAFEVTATQRGANRWDPKTKETEASPRGSTEVPLPVRSGYRLEALSFDMVTAADRNPSEPDDPGVVAIPFHEVGFGAFKTHLPLVASLAAGDPYHGFETGDLSYVEDVDWVKVPQSLAGLRRFVVRVAGDSMVPTLNSGDLVVFEFHRSPRRDREIVIANLPDFGRATDGTEAIKRLTQDANSWIFQSDNPAYEPFTVSKGEISHPILGIMVTKLG